jgi:hypothetical protein
MNRKLLIFFLIIVPLVWIVIGFRFDRTKYGTDPESAYLINGLNIAMGEPVGLYHHPGGTVQIYSAIVIRFTHLLRATDTDLQADVLLNSEFYIEALRKGLILINALIMFLMGYAAFIWLRNIWLALLLQMSPFISATVMELAFTKVSPEPLVVMSIMLLIILVLKYYTSQDQKNKWFPILFGILCGFGLATRITFIPILIIPFLIIRGRDNKFLFLVTILPSFVLFTLPLIPLYKTMFYWFRDIGTHTGAYGQGNAGLIDTNYYMNSIINIAKNNIEIIFAIVISIVLLLVSVLVPKFKKSLPQRREPVYIFAFLLAQAGTLLAVAKQYNNQYLVGALCLTGIILIFIFLYIKNTLLERKKYNESYSTLVLIIVFLGFTILTIPKLTMAFTGYRQSNKSTDETIARIERDYPGFVKTYYYPASFNQYAQLRWGNVYAQQFHTNRLMALFPEGIFYNAWEKTFQFWETTITPGEFLKKYGGHILLIGGPLNNADVKLVSENGLKLNKLFEGRIQVVYEIDTAQSALFQDVIHPGKAIRVIQSDFETVSDDKQWVLANGERFCKNSSLATEKPRSGKYSIAMHLKDSYAMEYELNHIKPGQRYEVSIWRFGGDEETPLVVSAFNSDLFYSKSKVTVEKDVKGWCKIVLAFKVPDGFKEDRLKVYLWNHSDKPAWFDDFELTQYK